MKRDALLAWVDRHYGGSTDTVAVVDSLLESVPNVEAHARAFQLALNDRDRFGVLKLVHVADWSGPQPSWATELAPVRREVLGSVLDRVSTPVCAARFRGLVKALADAGFGDFYPTVGLDLAKNELVEASFYTQHRPADVATCVTRETLGRAIKTPKGLFASGFDLIPDGRLRLKLYVHARRENLFAADVTRPLAALPLTDVLALRRVWLDGDSTLDQELKLYAQFGNLPAETLISTCREGRLSAFFDWAAPALRGTEVAFVSADDAKVEVYFE